MAATVLVVVVVVMVGWLFPEFGYLVTFVVAWTLADLAADVPTGVQPSTAFEPGRARLLA
jgi:hypothetical protein